jgi:outer membrane protein
MRKLLCALLFVATALPARAQGTGSALSLGDALNLARQNNPVYLQSMNGKRRAEAQLRYSYGQLLPQASTSLSAGYRQGRPEFIGGVAFGAASDILSSSWGLNFSARVSVRELQTIKQSRAQLDAADASVKDADQNLRSVITQQYILVLQLIARAALQDSLVTANQLQLDLANAKTSVGVGVLLDVKRAEVAIGQTRISALKAHNTADVEMLHLYQQIGVSKPDSVALTSTFQISEPSMQIGQLLDMAKTGNPALQALRSQEVAAAASYRASKGDYAPSLSFSASFGGTSEQFRDPNYLVGQAQSQTLAEQASCFSQDSLRRGAGLSSIASICNQFTFTPAQASAIRSANEQFPFKFTTSPYNLSLGLSLPLFDGFGRENNVQQAAANRSDARYNVRAQELKLVADVTAAYTTLVADYRTVRLQEAVTQVARDALLLAQERYRVGLNSLVDLQQSRSDFETADEGLIDANFEFHRAYAALESAVGRALR